MDYEVSPSQIGVFRAQHIVQKHFRPNDPSDLEQTYMQMREEAGIPSHQEQQQRIHEQRVRDAQQRRHYEATQRQMRQNERSVPAQTANVDRQHQERIGASQRRIDAHNEQVQANKAPKVHKVTGDGKMIMKDGSVQQQRQQQPPTTTAAEPVEKPKDDRPRNERGQFVKPAEDEAPAANESSIAAPAPEPPATTTQQ